MFWPPSIAYVVCIMWICLAHDWYLCFSFKPLGLCSAPIWHNAWNDAAYVSGKSWIISPPRRIFYTASDESSSSTIWSHACGTPKKSYQMKKMSDAVWYSMYNIYRMYNMYSMYSMYNRLFTVCTICAVCTVQYVVCTVCTNAQYVQYVQYMRMHVGT